MFLSFYGWFFLYVNNLYFVNDEDGKLIKWLNIKISKDICIRVFNRIGYLIENGKVVIIDFGLFSVIKICYGNRYLYEWWYSKLFK